VVVSSHVNGETSENQNPELRAVAALNNVELITALISCNRQLGLVGLQLRILNGVVSLLTTEVQNKALGAYLSEQGTASANLDLTTATLEVLACIAFKQPIGQAEIDRLFDVDKRGLAFADRRGVVILRVAFQAF
jgi:chromosome segregation and condensation protein ScpB